MRLLAITILVFVTAIIVVTYPNGERPVIFMATTTTQDSGLLGILIPELERDTGLKINSVAFGTSKVLRSAMDGNADVILVHDPKSELEFMDAGFGSERLAIMFNYFVLIGPEDDPANVKSSTNTIDAFRKIIESGSTFVSRADQSGTHFAELKLWQYIDDSPQNVSPEHYIQTGSGMGRTLNVAVEKSAYVLADSATWAAYKNKGHHKVLFGDDENMINTYHLITVNTAKHPHISPENQKRIVDWFKTEKARFLIGNYKSAGQQLYFPISAP